MDNVYKIVFSSVSDGHRNSRVPCVLKCSISLFFSPFQLVTIVLSWIQREYESKRKGVLRGIMGVGTAEETRWQQKARNEDTNTDHKAGNCDPHGPSCCLPTASTSGCSLML